MRHKYIRKRKIETGKRRNDEIEGGRPGGEGGERDDQSKRRQNKNEAV